MRVELKTSVADAALTQNSRREGGGEADQAAVRRVRRDAARWERQIQGGRTVILVLDTTYAPVDPVLVVEGVIDTPEKGVGIGHGLARPEEIIDFRGTHALPVRVAPQWDHFLRNGMNPRLRDAVAYE